MKILPELKVGWGVLEPDPEISGETLALIEKVRALPRGQRDALLTRAVPRYLWVEEGLEPGERPDRDQMVACTGRLIHLFEDILGQP